MSGVVVVGAGRWGPNLARNFAAVPGCSVRWVCDLDLERARRAALVVGARASIRLDDALSDPEVDVAAIATPAATHMAVARQCLEADRHVLVEKPLTTTLTDAVTLAEHATRRGLVIACDHTYCYHPALTRLRTLVVEGELGDLRRIESTRVNCGEAQPGIDVFSDLGHHDVAILDYVLPPGRRPLSVSARGTDPTGLGRASAGELQIHLQGRG